MLKIQIGLVSVSGQDAQKFLQAIVSSDVSELEVGAGQPSLLLTPAGKLVAAMYIFCESDERYLCVVEYELKDSVSENLLRYLIRTKAEIKDESNDFSGVVASLSELQESNTQLVHERHLNIEGLFLGLGKPIDESEKENEIYNELRISTGSVSTARDLSDEIIPQEANLDKLAISFYKGCFLGQELVCRIDSREASTPFSYFAIELDSLVDADFTDAQVLLEEQVVGKIVSARKTFENTGFENFGRYHAIARINRKGSANIQPQADLKIETTGDSKTFEIKNIDPVSGYFSI